jgi:hypothetical protein
MDNSKATPYLYSIRIAKITINDMNRVSRQLNGGVLTGSEWFTTGSPVYSS